MKKIFSIFITVALLLSLAACDESVESKSTSDRPSIKDADVYFWTDEETGVQYVVYANKVGYAGLGGITPRLNADGTLHCDTEKGGAE